MYIYIMIEIESHVHVCVGGLCRVAGEKSPPAGYIYIYRYTESISQPNNMGAWTTYQKDLVRRTQQMDVARRPGEPFLVLPKEYLVRGI